MKILVGISGWVDSAVSAYLLKQAGHDVVGGFMINYLDESDSHCSTKQDLEEFKRVVEWLDIPYEIWDFREEYSKKILDYIYDWYLSGITPNPDVLCNNLIKFWLFLDEGLKLWFDLIATGHYARIWYEDKMVDVEDIWLSSSDENSLNLDNYQLYRWIDESKDQSYFLSWLATYQLSRSIFPLGWLKKSAVRAIAKDIWLPNADRKDSQWLCFVGNIPMSKFLMDKIWQKPWAILDKDWHIIWQHNGAYMFTIWQRKGIWLPYQSYVIDIDISSNTITVWDEDSLDLFRSEILIKSMHWIWQKPSFWLSLWWYRCWCKVRYRQAIQGVIVFELADWSYKIVFDTPQKWVPNGQVAVLYLEDQVLWSGIISS